MSGKLNSKHASISSSDKLITTVVGILTLIFIWLGIGIPMILGCKGGSTEGMVITACGTQIIYFTSLLDIKYAPNFSGYMQFFRTVSFELDSMPNIYTDYFMNQGDRNGDLLRADDMNFYEIANMIEFNSLKLLALFLFNFI